MPTLDSAVRCSRSFGEETISGRSAKGRLMANASCEFLRNRAHSATEERNVEKIGSIATAGRKLCNGAMEKRNQQLSLRFHSG